MGFWLRELLSVGNTGRLLHWRNGGIASQVTNMRLKKGDIIHVDLPAGRKFEFSAITPGDGGSVCLIKIK